MHQAQKIVQKIVPKVAQKVVQSLKQGLILFQLQEQNLQLFPE